MSGASSGVQRRLPWAMLLRLLVVSALLGGTIVTTMGPAQQLDAFTPRLLIWLIVATFVLVLVSAPFVSRGGPRALAITSIVQVGWDLLLATGLVYVSWGVGSGFTFLYGLAVLEAALLLGPRGAYGTAAASFVLYAGITLLLTRQLLTPPPDQPPERYVLPPGELTYAVVSTVVAVALVGVLSSSLAERLSRAGGALRAAERARDEMTVLHRDTIHSLASGLLTTGLDGLIDSCNPAASEILATTADRIVGSRLADWMPDAAAAPDGTVRMESLVTLPDRSVRPVGFTRQQLENAEGQARGVLVVFQDLSEMVRLRETAERAEKFAAIGRLAAALAHEIRNPLSSISGAVQLVSEAENLGEEDRRLLGLVLKETSRLNELVSTMLDLSRPRPPQFSPLDLAALAREVADVAAQGQGRDVTARNGEPSVMVWADPSQLRQVVWNLVKNAMQASGPDGKVEVAVGSRPDGSVVLEVSDDGPGIEPIDKERIFDAFYSTRTHGVGIGLALVRQIVEAHGAKVEVESPPGAGAVFRVELCPPPPRDDGAETPEATSGATPPSETSAT